MLSLLPTVTPLRLDSLTTRPGASSGLWLVILVPLACSPGFYTTFLHCSPSPRLLSLLALQVGISGVHLYQQICMSGRHQKNQEDDPEASPSFMLQVITHPYTPALVTAVVICLLTEIHPVVALICTSLCAWILYESTQWLFRAFPGNFSLGEGAVVGQFIALTITCSLYNLFVMSQEPRLSQTLEISVFIQVAVLVLSLMVFVLHKVPLLKTPRMFFPVLCASGVVGVALSSLILGEWIPLWLSDVFTTSPIRLTLFAWWSGLVVLAILITVWTSRKSGIATTVLRKVYHLVIVAVFIPGILLDPTITHLTAAASMMLLCLLEFIRKEGIEPIASVISSAFSVFLDEKDGGVLILSHIYLLAGVASPLWLHPCPLDEVQGITNTPSSLLPMLAGVLAVGVGDAAASVCGTYFGRKKWSGTNKTVEGSVCGIVAQLVVVSGLEIFGLLDVSWAVWGRLLVSTTLVAIVEALTDQVDNIVLPLLLYTSLMDL